jgi:hypothetical protein
MENNLTELEQKIIDKIEEGGIEMIQKNHLIWCYLDGKRNGFKSFDDYIESFSKKE